MSKINEKELKEIFIKIKWSDNKVFEELYKKYYSLVYSIAFSILKNKDDSEDVVQTVFTKIFKIDKEQLPQKSEASWLYQVTKNEAISYMRRKAPEMNLESIYDIQDNDNEINNVIDKENYNRLIDKLNDKEKQVISLKILAGLSFEEIAKLLNEPTGTIKWRYYKSIHTLKLLLSNLGMFIITFVIGIKTLVKEQDTNSAQITEDNANDEESESIEDEEITLDSVYENSDIENETTETAIIEDVQETYINYYSIGILSLSAIFLVLTITFSIFLTKCQLKGHSKTSK